MSSSQIVLDKIVEKIVDIVIQSVGRHLGYLFHYKQNVRNLEVQMDELQVLRRTIEGQIEEAKNRGEVIMENVSAWQNGAEGLRQRVETFMHYKIDKENVQCFKFSCPNFISRYKLSKEAEKKMGDVKSLSEKANFGTISQPAPPLLELQFPSSEEYVSFDSRESVFNGIKDALADTKKINVVDSHDPLHEIAKAVCRECRGLPVAVLAVGAALKGKRTHAWKSSLDKLKKSMLNTIDDIDPKLFTSLRLSYDYLESTDAKSCFLLCCLFPEDSQVPIVALARHCMARRLLGQKPDTSEEAIDNVRSVVDTLKTRCLLLDGKNDDFVKMHDVIRDVAISIAKEEEAYLVKHGVQEWPETGTYEKYSAISLRSETIHELPDELVCPELHTLMLECRWRTKIPDKFFGGTEKLMVLELNKATVLPLPSSLGKLTELRMLCLNECKLGDIAILKDLKNKLEVLILRGSNIKALPLELGELTCLRLLDLRDCRELKVIPNGVISKLHRLEELHFPVSFENWKGTTANEEISKVSVEELMSLTRLSTLDICIPFLRLLPEDLGFLNLSKFFIKVGSPRLGYRRQEFSSTSVVLNKVNFENEGLIDFSILERLLGKPKWSMERGGLCPSRSFNNLTELVLLECKLKYLFSPSCARRLLQLQRLVIRDCGTMEAVIGNFGNEEEKDEEIVTNVISFSQLTTLELFQLPRLISFYPRIKKATATESHSFSPAQSLFNEKVAFPALEELSIDSLPNITEIWDKKNLLPTDQSFRLLRSLKVSACEELMNVVPSHVLPRLRNIETLKVLFCSKMEVMVVLEKREEEATNKDIIPFPELRSLRLRELKNLKAVCAYKSEDQLDFNVQVVFPKLRIMSLWSLERLSSFNNTSNITETRPLFNHQVAFPALEELYIRSVPNITEIWDKKNLLPTDQSFYLLRSLKVEACKKLMNVVPSHMLPRLRNVETLEVRSCSTMEVMVVLEKREEEATNKDIILFPELRSLWLIRLENLKAVCAYKPEDQLNFNVQVVFPKLRILLLESLGRLSSFNNTSNITETRPLFNHQVAFPALEELGISKVNITEIWDKNLLPTDQSFRLLRSLSVSSCEGLMNVVPSHVLPRLRNVETLDVHNCSKMEVIVVLEKREEAASNKDIIPFPELRRLKLERLKNLKAVCAYKSEDQLDFNVQVVFPKLRKQGTDVVLSSLKNFNQECAIMDESGNRIQLRRP
ncbi:hypothetical protein Vadar_017675 [Vaccinium darrowii]|uniref:Uncharacterized protein n=1 Tax=Vaccinium darrowii TaxID=229202 RepID=A0ACB7XRF8_9ERIC|nr:hypothetical protein Vadar_017675 [Vaccinium darrowii]